MLRIDILPIALSATAIVAQQVNFPPKTGNRSLWIPFKTISGTPVASILSDDASNHETVYVLSCPTGQADCAISPDLTLTEGISSAMYTTSNSAGRAVVGCTMSGSQKAICSEEASGQGEVRKGPLSTLAPSQIVYQAVQITALPSKAATESANGSNTGTMGTTSANATAATNTLWTGGGIIGAAIAIFAAL